MAIDFAASDEALDSRTHLVSVRGEIDLFTAPEFKQHVNAALDSGRPLLIVDLGGATFIDSSSLGIIIAANRRMAERDGRLVIACDVQSILSTLRITGLDGMLEIVPTRDTALATA
jgi:anti-sigma B factor antagonist